MFSLISVSLLVSKTNGNELEKKKRFLLSVHIHFNPQTTCYKAVVSRWRKAVAHRIKSCCKHHGAFPWL